MTFILGHDKILEAPIPVIANLIAFFYTSNDLERLIHLRALLVVEQLQAVRTGGRLHGVYLEQALQRIRGINWKLGVAMMRAPGEKERLQILANEFWSGMEVVSRACTEWRDPLTGELLADSED